MGRRSHGRRLRSCGSGRLPAPGTSSAPVPKPVLKPRCLRELLCLPGALGSHALVLTRADEVVLALQTPVAVQTVGSDISAIDGGSHPTPRLAAVRAVAKAAVAGPLLDICKRMCEAFIRVPQL